jgi:hypothetical protein
MSLGCHLVIDGPDLEGAGTETVVPANTGQ